MTREGDGERMVEHYRFVRYCKAAIGLIFAMGAVMMVILPSETGEHSHTLHMTTVLTFAILSGMTFNAPGITSILSQLVDKIPGAPSRPKEEG